MKNAIRIKKLILHDVVSLKVKEKRFKNFNFTNYELKAVNKDNKEIIINLFTHSDIDFFIELDEITSDLETDPNDPYVVQSCVERLKKLVSVDLTTIRENEKKGG